MRPKYLKQTSRGKAYAGVKLDGKVHSLGIYDSPESLAMYERLVSEWRSGNLERQSFNVDDLVYADGYYRKAGELTSEIHAVRAACQRLHDLYGDLTASKFGPRQFKTVRDGMVRDGEKRNRDLHGRQFEALREKGNRITRRNPRDKNGF
ncbi:MAG: hypothetical protein P8I27_16310 [Pirellulaceae bacterium]|nr:hypothetical protein [Pirellulaceae bacterium]